MWVIREGSRTGLRAAVVFLLLAVADLPAAAQDDTAAVGEILSAGAPPVTDIDAALGSEALAELKQVYNARNDRPIWHGTAAGRDLLDRLSRPDVILGPKLRPLLDDARKRIDAPDSSARAGADLLLTALYGATAQALRPKAPAGFAAALAELATTTDLASLLREPAPKIETPQVETPQTLTPQAEAPPAVTPPAAPAEPSEIAKLRAAIAALQPQAEKGWPPLPDGPKLQLGDSGPRVEALSRRLIASGDLQATTPGAEFDLPLQSALERFQTRHGLPSDGVAGAATMAALNVPPAAPRTQRPKLGRSLLGRQHSRRDLSAGRVRPHGRRRSGDPRGRVRADAGDQRCRRPDRAASVLPHPGIRRRSSALATAGGGCALLHQSRHSRDR
jgi:hypothetical protein